MTKKQLFENLKLCIRSVAISQPDYSIANFQTIVPCTRYEYDMDGNTFHKLMCDLELDIKKEEEYKELIEGCYGGLHLLNVTNVIAYPVTKEQCAFKVVSFKSNPLAKFQVMFNQKTTILKIGNFKTVVKCDKRDRFVPIIGLGIALYRYYRQNKPTKGMIKSLETETKLSHLKLAEYAFNYFCDFNKSKAKKACELINKYEEGKWIDLCL